MPVIGLTGGIGAGKSCISRRLRQLGCYIVDADKISHALTRSESGLKMLAEAFGSGILLESGGINRKYLATTVFIDAQKRAQLNDLLHPIILEKIRRRTANLQDKHEDAIIVWDVPLLIETKLHEETDAVWVVTAPMEARIARITRRNGLSRNEAMRRIHSQLQDDQRAAYADVIINNDTTIDELYDKVDNALDSFRSTIVCKSQ